MRRLLPTLIWAIIILLLLHASWVIWRRSQTNLTLFSKPTRVTGVIANVPEYQKRRTRFILVTRSPSIQRIRMTWYGRYPWLRPGEVWQLTIKSSHNLLRVSPKFNYPQWLRWHDYTSAAYVVTKAENKKLFREPWYWQPINRMRYELRWRLFKSMRGYRFRDIMIALAMGDRSYLSKQRWQIFARTGTSHLIAISGLHVGLLAGILFLLLRWLLSCWPWITRKCPAQHLAMIGAVIGSGCYSVLAGLAVTTVRAFLMLLVVAIGMLWRRKLSLLAGWVLALLLIAFLLPGEFLSAGAWLSFGAVACLYYSLAHRLGPMPRHFSWWYPQWSIFIGLAPLVVYWFHQLSIVSVEANLVAIPIVSLWVLPLTLLGTVFAYLSFGFTHLLFGLANAGLAVLWFYLHWLASQSWWGVKLEPVSVWRCLVASIGALWVLAPRAVPARWAGLVLLSCLFQ